MACPNLAQTFNVEFAQFSDRKSKTSQSCPSIYRLLLLPKTDAEGVEKRRVYWRDETASDELQLERSATIVGDATPGCEYLSETRRVQIAITRQRNVLQRLATA